MLDIENYIEEVIKRITDFKIVFDYTNEPETIFINNSNILKNNYTFDRQYSVDTYYYTLSILVLSYKEGAELVEKLQREFYKTKSDISKGLLDIEIRAFGKGQKINGQLVFMIDLEIKKEQKYGD